jgi:metal-responsive CopG/Arc/MetJ family transcriptional regulator
MGRILVDIPQPCVDDLNAIAQAEKLPRAEVIRRAVAAYVEQNRPAAADAFGIWKQRRIDGVQYQEEVRTEW